MSVPTLGGCSSYSYSTGSYRVAINVTTKLADNLTPVNGDGEHNTPAECSNAIEYPASDVERNCFELTNYYSSSNLCYNPIGWKAVHARAMWQGSDNYLFCSNGCNSGSARYLNNVRNITGKMYQTGGQTNVTYSLDWLREYTVNPASGMVTQDQCVDTWTSSSYTETPIEMQLETWWIGLGIGCNQFDNSKYGGSWNMPIGSTAYFPGMGGNPDYAFQFPVDGWILTEREITETTATWTLASPVQPPGYTTWQGHLTFTSTLSKQYTLADVTRDATDLLNYWDLSNDIIYPWRIDGLCTRVPVIRRDEVFSTAEGAITAWGGCSGFYQTENDGHVIGQPLPIGYGQVSGSSNFGFYSWRQDYWTPDFEHLHGVWTPQYLTLYATWWLNQEEAGEYPFLASQASFPKGAYEFFNPLTNYFYIQKYVEVQPVVPAINFFRPCGKDITNFPNAYSICGRIPISSSVDGANVLVTLAEPALYLETNDEVDFENINEVSVIADIGRVVTVIDATHFTVDLPEPIGKYVKSHNAPSYIWNSNTSSGDYIILDWKTDRCDSTTTFHCTQLNNSLHNPCSVPVIPILPIGSVENFGNSNVITLPVIDKANSQINIIPISNIVDPFWVYPDEVEYVEARCSEPVGAPHLTSSLSLGCWETNCTVPENGDCSTYTTQEIGI